MCCFDAGRMDTLVLDDLRAAVVSISLCYSQGLWNIIYEWQTLQNRWVSAAEDHTGCHIGTGNPGYSSLLPKVGQGEDQKNVSFSAVSQSSASRSDGRARIWSI